MSCFILETFMHVIHIYKGVFLSKLDHSICLHEKPQDTPQYHIDC